MIEIAKETDQKVRQGDIIGNVEFVEHYNEFEGEISISIIEFPLVIVLTQDCDLVQDYNSRCNFEETQSNDKHLFSVLVAPLYNAEFVYTGNHLEELELTMEPINAKKSPGDFLRKNQRPRYHYLEFPSKTKIQPSVIDFKHYFSVNINYLFDLKKSNFICRVNALYREDICQRFASFLSRIALPVISDEA